MAEQYARLLAPKDEYEVARLLTAPAFREQLAANFEGDYRLYFHLAPPWLARPGPDGRPRKHRFGPWLLPLLKGLAYWRRHRDSWLDPLRFSKEHTVDRQLLTDYEADLALIGERGAGEAARNLAAWPAEVRGFGPVRAAALAPARQRRAAARQALLA